MMKRIVGHIDHRILLNYRIDPAVMQRQLPSGFKPKLVNGYAIGGICQVSLSNMRPPGLPEIVSTRSHNAAHRVAVTSSAGEGVYVLRRDTNSWLNTFSGGRFFPGVYKKAEFDVLVENNRHKIHIKNNAGKFLMIIDASITKNLPSGSVFTNKADISRFFEGGNIGWSSQNGNGKCDAIELKTAGWMMEPLAVQEEFSAYFTDEERFPSGTVAFDSGMIMRNVRHSWVSRTDLGDPCGRITMEH